jgi:hypothetical protein
MLTNTRGRAIMNIGNIGAGRPRHRSRLRYIRWRKPRVHWRRHLREARARASLLVLRIANLVVLSVIGIWIHLLNRVLTTC